MFDISAWVEFCRQELDERTQLPYISEPFSEQERQYFEDLSSNVTAELRQLEEEAFSRPEDVSIRYAALRLCYYQYLPSLPSVASEGVQVFCHLVRLVVPEACSSWSRLAWEISNTYLAKNWELLWSLFARAETLDDANRQEIRLLKAQFRFLQLFGAQIDHELRGHDFDYWYEWAWSIDCFESNALAKHPRFERPELIRPGSIEHFVLFRWCTNPHAPQRIPADDDNKKPDDDGFVEAGGQMVSRNYLRIFSKEVDFVRFPPPTEETQKHLHLVIEGLTSEISNLPETTLQYRPLLARSLFVNRQYAQAANCYQQLLDQDRNVFRYSVQELDVEDFGKEELLLSIANCYRLEGSSSRVEEAMMQLLQICPFGTYLKLAKIQAEMGEYQKAYENLRREANLNPTLDGNSWRATVLALGEVAEDQARARQEIARAFREAEPQAYATYVSIVSDYWPRFSKLCEPAQEAWVLGTNLAHDPRGDQRLLECKIKGAAFQFASAVEFELQSKVFGPFRIHARSAPELQQVMASGTQQTAGGKKSMDQLFLNFVSREDKVLTLKQMTTVISQSHKPGVTRQDSLGLEFAKWLKQHQEKLAQHQNQLVLNRVADLRNEAKAKRLGLQEARLLTYETRKILEIIS